MEAIAVNFRRGRHVQYPNQLILQVNGISSKEKAKSLIGKSLSWISPGKEKKEIKGEIKSTHGNSGAVRAKFTRGLPGQVLGTKIKIE